MKAAQRELEANNQRRALDLLEKYSPPGADADLRGFEWRVLWERCRAASDTLHAGPEKLAGRPDGAAAAERQVVGPTPSVEMPRAILGGICWSARSGDLLSVDTNARVSCWKDGRLDKIRTVRIDARPGAEVRPSQDGKSVLISQESGVVQVWALEGARFLSTLKLDAPLRFFVVSPDRLRLYGGPEQPGPARLWNLRTRDVEVVFHDYTPEACGMAFSPDSRRLVRAVTNHGVRRWDVAQRRETGLLDGHESPVTCVTFSLDGERLATLGREDDLCVRDATTGTLILASREPGKRSATRLGFAPTGRRLCSGSEDGLARLWCLLTGQEMLSLPGGYIASLSPDGRMLALQAADGTVRILNPPSLGQIDALVEAPATPPVARPAAPPPR